jgi:hypothetical protein
VLGDGLVQHGLRERPALHELLGPREIHARELVLRLEDVDLRFRSFDVLRRPRGILRRRARVGHRRVRARLRSRELGLRFTERRLLVQTIELHEHVPELHDIALAHVHLGDARRDAARDVHVDAIDDAGAAGGPVLGRAKVPHQEEKGDDQTGDEEANEDQGAFHDACFAATSKPVFRARAPMASAVHPPGTRTMSGRP